MNKKLKVFETFAGIGAQHKALEILKKNNTLDYEIVGTSEWDAWANISYHAIHNNNKNIAKELSDEKIDNFLKKFTLSLDSKSPAKFSSIKKLSRQNKEILYSSLVLNNNLSDITKVTGKQLFDTTKGIDLLTYSFPCQDLSTAGSFHGGNQGMKKGSGTRSGLLWEIERILKELKKIEQLPKFLLLENVRNMLSNAHIKDYEEWLKFLNSIGYNTQTYVLNSNDFGSPQKRTRVFGLSVLKPDYNFEDTFKETKEVIEKNNQPKSVSEIFSITKKLDEIITTKYTKDLSLNLDEFINSVPNNTYSRKKIFEDNPHLFVKNKEELTKNINYQKIKDGYMTLTTRTITTKQDRNPNAGVIDISNTIIEKELIKRGLNNKSRYRFLTPRECFMLMGFESEDFNRVIKEICRKDILLRQAGNSIAVNVLVSIFMHIKEQNK
ncbi:DNA-methyltransferase [Williamsoniiplasma somnilux]|uniref:Cytosine-specific methyltransferase n=1 Tax=Williamsoniiplasma somnilux TaxID=215578 RepID=A0A2K8NZS8_9MOLU|nr:DNA (cytosine-5-)-methyltransferase [Williamsoniiplasma somnilux]ATZ18718.1 DNA-methyltransferase [Williamsoniiplasma somnilux]